MSSLAHQAEILKLSRFLDIQPEKLAGLGPVEALAIRALREQATAAFFDDDRKLFQRVAAAAKLLPAGILALIAEKVMGPLLCARIAGVMEPPRAIAIAKRLPDQFLADVCNHLDPRHVEDIIAGVPINKVTAVAKELAQRGEYVTMGRFVGILHHDAIAQVVSHLTDNEALLRIAFFVEDRNALDAVLELVPKDRLEALIQTAASGADLWPEALGMMGEVSQHWRRELGDLAAGMDEAIINSMTESIQQHGLWRDALPIVADMSQASKQRLASLRSVTSEPVLSDIMLAADQYDLWPDMLPLVPLMTDEGQALAAKLSAKLDGEQLLHVADAATQYELWPVVLDLIERMQPEQRETVMTLIGAAPERMLDGLLQTLDGSRHWDELAGSMASMHGAKRLLDRADVLGLAARLRL